VAVFCYFAGLRIFEAVKLKKKDVRLMERGKGVSVNVMGKGAKHRVTYIMVEHVVKHVKTLLKREEDMDEYLFMKNFWLKNESKNIDEESLKAQRLGHYLGTTIKEQTNYPTHSLRRAFATHLCKMGCADSTIQACLGHSSFDTTRRYIDDEVLFAKVSADIKGRLASRTRDIRGSYKEKTVTTMTKSRFFTHKY